MKTTEYLASIYDICWIRLLNNWLGQTRIFQIYTFRQIMSFIWNITISRKSNFCEIRNCIIEIMWSHLSEVLNCSNESMWSHFSEGVSCSKEMMWSHISEGLNCSKEIYDHIFLKSLIVNGRLCDHIFLRVLIIVVRRYMITFFWSL